MMFVAAMAVGSHLVLAADRPPQFDPQASCRSAAETAGMSGRRSADCVRDEQIARDSLEKSWVQFSAADKAHCGGLVSTGGLPSYVELLSCLEMSRDARGLAADRAKDQPESASGAARLPAAGIVPK